MEVRPLRDGQNSIVLTAKPGNRHGISGKELLKQLLKPSLCRDVSRFKNSLKPAVVNR